MTVRFSPLRQLKAYFVQYPLFFGIMFYFKHLQYAITPQYSPKTSPTLLNVFDFAH